MTIDFKDSELLFVDIHIPVLILVIFPLSILAVVRIFLPTKLQKPKAQRLSSLAGEFSNHLIVEKDAKQKYLGRQSERLRPVKKVAQKNQERSKVLAIESAVREKINITCNGLANSIERSYLAAIVITSKDITSCDIDNVICLATGAKYIRRLTSLPQFALNDCHAEMLVRRRFRNFLINQIKETDNDCDKSILAKIESGGYRLKDGFEISLFLNHLPCGDANIHDDDISVPSSRIKCDNDCVRLDEVRPHQAHLYAMSCTDKIALWSFTGLQGSLLSNYIEPIYLRRVIVSTSYNANQLRQSLNWRLDNFNGQLPKMYKVKKPLIYRLKRAEQNHQQQIGLDPSLIASWAIGSNEFELINASTGKLANGQSSKLSKLSHFHDFAMLSFGKRNVTTLKESNFKAIYPLSYNNVKRMAKSYHEAKQICLDHFQQRQLGQWIRAPDCLKIFMWAN